MYGVKIYMVLVWYTFSDFFKSSTRCLWQKHRNWSHI